MYGQGILTTHLGLSADDDEFAINENDPKMAE